MKHPKKNNTKAQGMTFPCQFVVKVIGKNKPDFQNTVRRLFETHFPEQTLVFQSRDSTAKKFIAYSVDLHIEKKSELDALYQTLSDSPDILVAL